jgi:hypothetical protein
MKPATKQSKEASIRRPEEGDIFAVPLEDKRFAAAVIARVEMAKPRKPYGIFVYFFGPYQNLSGSAFQSDSTIRADKALCRLQTSALAIYDGTWPKVGHIEHWNSADWPFPEFYEIDFLDNKIFKVKLSEFDLLRRVSRVEIDSTEGLDENSLHGCESARNHVAKIMRAMSATDLRTH